VALLPVFGFLLSWALSGSVDLGFSGDRRSRGGFVPASLLDIGGVCR